MPTIIFGDCRTVLKKLRTNSFHLCITSPPYNLGIRYPDWNDNLPLDAYFDFSREWLSECYRVLVTGGRLCLNIPFFIHKTRENLLFGFLDLLQEIGFLDREMIVWVKKRHQDNDFVCKQRLFGSVASPSCPHLRSVCEIILIVDKEIRSLPGRRQDSDLTVPEYEAWTKNVWELDTEGDRRHPAPFPFELPRRLMKLYSYKGNRVLDPFAGRGTTLKVAKQLNRIGVAIELSEAYLPLIQETVGQGLKVHRIPKRLEARLKTVA
jgi:site-specific DNA-methyltransferase (adenine-specific)